MTIDDLIHEALAEDLIFDCDITTDLFISKAITGVGWIEARQEGIVSGLKIVEKVFQTVDKNLELQRLAHDGDEVKPLQKVLAISGGAASILHGERTALNFLGHLSGISTLTRKFIDAAKPNPAKILCTRKTTPGLRALEVEAVRHGGGDAFRTNLSDAVLLKDNHLGILGGLSGVEKKLSDLQNAGTENIASLLANGKIEVSSLEELSKVVQRGWSHVLLDNFSPDLVRQAVQQWGDRVFLEASGGITISNVAEYAATGVHAISIGALTHSATAADFSLEVEWRRP